MLLNYEPTCLLMLAPEELASAASRAGRMCFTSLRFTPIIPKSLSSNIVKGRLIPIGFFGSTSATFENLGVVSTVFTIRPYYTPTMQIYALFRFLLSLGTGRLSAVICISSANHCLFSIRSPGMSIDGLALGYASPSW